VLSVALLSLFLVAEPPTADPDSLGLESSPSSCVVPTAPNPNAPAVYQLSPDGSVPAGLVGPAIAAWNSPGCNPNGTGFPTFASTPEPGALVIPVRFEPGPNPAGQWRRRSRRSLRRRRSVRRRRYSKSPIAITSAAPCRLRRGLLRAVRNLTHL